MASVRATPTGRWELTIRNRLLPKRVYLTFDTELEATGYGEQVERLLAMGVVPRGLVPDAPATQGGERLGAVLRAWMDTGQPARTDLDVLGRLVIELGTMSLPQLTYAWAEAWVAGMKRSANLSPSTIRKRIGSLSRAIDWWLRCHPDVSLGNPIKLLPRGAATYNLADKSAAVAAGGVAKTDQGRTHRVAGADLERVIDALNGVRRPDRERPCVAPDDVAFRALFWLIFYTGVRLREAYTLRVDQVGLLTGGVRSIRVRTSKQWHDNVKWRNVPIRSELASVLLAYGSARPADGLLFDYWSGERDEDELRRATGRLSARFSSLFRYAGCDHLTEHDLRHEATCQWLDLRDAKGQWVFRREEVDSIMGWSQGSQMSERYASFRAEDFAARLLP